MRILVFSSYWPRQSDVHSATFEVEQVRAMAEAGHKINVVVQTPVWRRRAAFLGAAQLSLDPALVQVDQIVLPRLPEGISRYPLAIRLNIWMSGQRIKNWMGRYRAKGVVHDLVLVHGERNIGLSAGIWNRDLRYRAAAIVHGADPVLEAASQDFLHDYIGNVANAGLSRIILVGNRLQSYARHIGYDERRVKVIPNGFSKLRRPVRSDKKAGPAQLISVARLVPVKGIDDALRALAALIERNPNLKWRYLIVGDGPERGGLQELTKNLGLGARVQFLGAIPNQKVLKLLEESAVFVLPSWNEAFGLAYLEAMAMGAAVVGCLENGAADIITDGVDGCLVRPRSVEDLSKVLEDLIADPRRRELLSRAAMESVERFSWTENARTVIESTQHE